MPKYKAINFPEKLENQVMLEHLQNSCKMQKEVLATVDTTINSKLFDN